MTTSQLLLRPDPSVAPETRPESPERHLQPVAPASEAPRRSPLFLALTAVLALVGIMAVQLWLSIATSSSAYEVHALLAEEQELQRTERVLAQNIDTLASPQHLAEQAIGLGMVQNANPAFLRLADGTVAGELAQQRSAPRANLIPNAALQTMTHGGAPAETQAAAVQQGEGTPAAASEETAPEPAAATETAGEETQQPAPPAQEPPTEPVPWEGKLPAPRTH